MDFVHLHFLCPSSCFFFHLLLMWSLLSTTALFNHHHSITPVRQVITHRARNLLQQHLRQSNTIRCMSTTEKTINLDLELPTNDKNPNLLQIRHSTAHVMAMAVQKLFPKVKVTIGPWVDNG